MNPQIIDQLRRENAALISRVEEAEDALRALRAGEIDAVLIAAEREQIYTLETADKPYRLLVEQMPQGAATVTADGTIIYCNARFSALLNQPLQTLLEKPLARFIAPDSRPQLEALLRDAQLAEVQGEITLRGGDGSPMPAYVSVRLVKEGVLGSCLIVTDLTEQRHYDQLQRTQEALHASQERLELAQRVGHIGTFDWDIDSGMMNWSAAMEELYGLPAGHRGSRYEDWKLAIHPGDRQGVETQLRAVLAQGAELDIEFRIIRPDGKTRWIASQGRVFYTADRQPVRLLGVAIDITERKRTEALLRDADRKKDEFLVTLAHELRNPLTAIRNAVRMLSVSGPSSTSNLDWSRGVLERQVQLMARLLEDLLDVSRISRNTLELRKERCDLTSVLDAALETSHPVIESGGHELNISLPREPIHLDADPMRLAQAFANLLNNAAKYTPHGGRICLAAERRKDHVLVSVTDNGMGIAAEVLPHIFEIFSQASATLAQSQGGLGIGLSLVKGLVELHGGSIEAASEGPGQGSAFFVRLPLAAEKI